MLERIDPSLYLASISNALKDDVLILELNKRYALKATEFYPGRNRNVFRLGSYVAKIPNNYAGMLDNDWECSISNTESSRNNKDHIQYPRTHLGLYKTIPVCFMEYVVPIEGFGDSTLPEWCDMLDCMQVGYTKSGRLVAYDYGRN